MAVSVFAVPSTGRAPASGCHNALRVPAWKLGFATLIIGGLEMCVIGVPSWERDQESVQPGELLILP